jgi:tryptophanyl-tRNA synthetase
MSKLFSGIQPSGEIHIGNYIGALKQWVELQNKYESIFSIVDYHAITVDYNPAEMQKRILDCAKDLIAIGIDPQKSILFVQSHRPEHTELAWILTTLTELSELDRMTQFKQKSGISVIAEDYQKRLKRDFDIARNQILHALKEKKLANHEVDTALWDLNKETARKYQSMMIKVRGSSSMGLLSYPVLQAADILIYKAEAVPVGEDQVQHVELARDLARRFNTKFSEIFPEPKPILVEGARVLGLDGKGKMSKSNASSTYIGINDKPEIIREKISSATTDQGNEPEISNGTKNLIGLLGVFAGKEVEEKYMAERRAGTIKYSDLKPALADAIIKTLEPIQKKRAELSDDEVKKILSDGAAKLKEPAQETIKEVKSTMGLI